MIYGFSIINKIFKSICEEASRKPGNNLVLNLLRVMSELNVMVMEYIACIQKKESKELNDKNGHR